MIKSAIKLSLFITLSILFNGLSAVNAQEENALTDFQKCTKITEDAKRLTCFDSAAKGLNVTKIAAKLKEAKAAKIELSQIKAKTEKLAAEKTALIAADKKRISEDKQREFDEFGLPTYSGQQLKVITSTIKQVKKSNLGTLYIVIENGAKWRKMDEKKLGRIAPGDEVKISKGFLGGYRIMVLKNKRTSNVKRVL